LANQGFHVPDQIVGNVLQRFGIPPVPKRGQETTWRQFNPLETRRVTPAGNTRHPTADWMPQPSLNATDVESGHLPGQRYLLHDRGTELCPALLNVLRTAGVQLALLPP
jgi:hypothetical protein